MDIHLSVITLVFVYFAVATLRQGAWHWLWFSVVLWLVLGLFSAQILPRVLGITHTANAYLAHAYLGAGSIFYWLNHVRRNAAGQYESTLGAGLTLLAHSNSVMHLAFIILATLVWWQYPTGLTVFIAPILAWFYANAAIWWLMCAMLMLLFAVHRNWLVSQKSTVFTMRQLYVGFLLALCWQFLFVAAALGYLWYLPR